MKLAMIKLADLPMYAALLNEWQAVELRGQTFLPDSYFNPIQDIDDNWVLSAEEVAYCANPDFLWIKDLEMIPFTPKPAPPMFGMETSE
jgi:peptidoglycan/LPS O-acetylase OafA/YrhL